MANAELAERARMFEERAEKATDPPGNTTEKWSRLLSIAVSRTPGRSIRMRVGGPSGSLFKRQVALDHPFAYHPPPGRVRAKGEVEIARARDLSRYPRPISAAFAAGPLPRRSR